MKELKIKICLFILVFSGIFFAGELDSLSLNRGVEDQSLFDTNVDSISSSKGISVFLNKYIASENDPEILIQEAFFILSTHKYGDSLSNDAANFILQRATQIIEEFQYNSNPFKLYSYRRMAMQLQEQGFPVDIPLSNIRKVFINLKQKNYHYLFTRLQLQLKTIVSNSIANHKVFFAGSVFLLTVFIGFQIKKRRYIYPILFILICPVVGLLYGKSSERLSVPRGSFQGAMFHFQIGE